MPKRYQVGDLSLSDREAGLIADGMLKNTRISELERALRAAIQALVDSTRDLPDNQTLERTMASIDAAREALGDEVR